MGILWMWYGVDETGSLYERNRGNRSACANNGRMGAGWGKCAFYMGVSDTKK